ncbi:uncharacterized protein LACBIDRAFT_302000 [Laccaria bicolor S238N-H82]|uniref:Predicted protein n=1 Tax=Laccaria bicolor (strain S238N-H82 / ATCC MYA-4686) TaxID=486041 RepID=B0CQC1_LACBS|nr:uncharacterized protein LACBIDRAFT_302000 [Laccaria bicolor S238N-H82]EDR15528.1 predicted protein [Laccaria bicolor S238N-H82]|eukprot:XP_001873736.1 predicted protein [Laccaria bicolor S238N-H82]
MGTLSGVFRYLTTYTWSHFFLAGCKFSSVLIKRASSLLQLRPILTQNVDLLSIRC